MYVMKTLNVICHHLKTMNVSAYLHTGLISFFIRNKAYVSAYLQKYLYIVLYKQYSKVVVFKDRVKSNSKIKLQCLMVEYANQMGQTPIILSSDESAFTILFFVEELKRCLI